MGILVFLLVLTLVVTIHEFGHYVACRMVGIRVSKFGIGFGKPLLKYQREGGTEWSLRPWPFGGFIEPNQFEMAAANPLTKAFVAVAGPLANIGPFIVLAALFGKFVLVMTLLASMYWLGIVGIANTLTLPLRMLFHTHTAAVASASGGDLVGPIGLGHASVQATAQHGAGFTFVLLFVLLSLGLGLINLVPIPPLDGGRVLLAAIEAVVGKRRIGRVSRVVNYAGLSIMLILVLVITSRDIARLF